MAGASILAVPSGTSNEVDLWDVQRGALAGTVCPPPKKGMVFCLKLLHTASSDVLLVSGLEDGSLLLWSLRSGTLQTELKLHNEPVLAFDCDEVGQHLYGVSGSAEKNLAAFRVDLQTMKTVSLEKIELPNEGTNVIVFRPDRKIYAAGCWDHRVRIYSLRKNRHLATLQYHTGPIQSLAFSPDSRWLVSGGQDCNIALWAVYPPHPAAPHNTDATPHTA